MWVEAQELEWKGTVALEGYTAELDIVDVLLCARAFACTGVGGEPAIWVAFLLKS